MAKQVPGSQGPFYRGERLTAAKLNGLAAQIRPATVYGAGHVEGDATLVDSPESMWIRLTGKATGTPIKYAWKRVSRLANGTWQDLTHTGNTTNDYAVEANNASLTVNTTTVYPASRSLTTGEWLFRDAGGGGGNVSITSGETVLMILGTYDDYKNCPDVPGSPPTLTTDYCNGTTGTTLCVPAYAYAVYQRCGYVWNKIGDTRTYGVWANELNGQSFSAYRRFVIPRWGGDLSGGVPEPSDVCMGVAFLGTGAGSALSCSCPSWADGKCLQIKFRTTPRPCPYEVGNISCGYTDCAGLFTTFDSGDSEGPFWDREFTVNITLSGCAGSSQFGGGTSAGDVNIEFVDTARDECYWGPDVFDPCDPCAGFGYFRIYFLINTEQERVNCGGSYHVLGKIPLNTMRQLLCDCEAITPSELKSCTGCDGNVGLTPLVAIDTESIELICCPE